MSKQAFRRLFGGMQPTKAGAIVLTTVFESAYKTQLSARLSK